jgi:hypothetical protein
MLQYHVYDHCYNSIASNLSLTALQKLRCYPIFSFLRLPPSRPGHLTCRLEVIQRSFLHPPPLIVFQPFQAKLKKMYYNRPPSAQCSVFRNLSSFPWEIPWNCFGATQHFRSSCSRLLSLENSMSTVLGLPFSGIHL